MQSTPISIITPPELRRQGERWNVVYYEKKRLRRIYVGSVNLPKSEINRRANEIIARILTGETPKPKQSETLIQALQRIEAVYLLDLRKQTQVITVSILKKYYKFLIENGFADQPVHLADEKPIEAYRRERLKVLNPNTLRTELAKIKTLYNRLNLEKTISVNTSSVKQVRGEDKFKRAYTLEERDKLFDYAKTHNPNMYLVYMLVHYAFVRPTEVLRLTWQNVDLENGCIIIGGKQSKNKKTGRIELTDNIIKLLKTLCPEKANGLLLPDFEGKVYNNLYITHTTILRELDLDNELTIYALKHTGVKMLYAQTNDIDHIRELCRHSNISMTYTYLRGLGESVRKDRTIKGVEW